MSIKFINNDAPGDVISILSSENELDHDEENAHLTLEEAKMEEAGKKSSTPGQKRPREDEDESDGSDGYSPASDIDVESPPRGSKRARLSSRPVDPHSHQGSEEGEVDEADDEPNPRAALETGKTASGSAPSRNDGPAALRNPADSSSSSSSAAGAGAAVASKSSLPTSSQMSSAELLPENTEADDLEPFAGSTMPSESPTYTAGSSAFKLPALSPKKQGSWFARVKDWVQVLCQHNLESISAVTPAVAMDAFAFYLDQHSGLRQAKRRAAKQAAKKVETSRTIQNVIESLKLNTNGTGSASEPTAGSHVANQNGTGANQSEGSMEEGQVSSGVTKDSPPENAQELHQNRDTSIVRKDVPTGEEEFQQQRRYFPSAADASTMCLLCGGENHKAIHCTRSKCRFCKSIDHWDFCCPSIQERCDKCRQLGHQTASCTEKLALTKDEGLACAYCNSNDHLEGNCTEVWRSFQPNAHTIHPVVYLPCSCSVCGGTDHFSGDCRERRGISANPTWSLQNRNIYIDPKCNALSIEEIAGPIANQRSLRGFETRTRGHAPRTANIVHFSESDDSDVEFLSRRAIREPKGGAGKIRLSSNIQLSQMMGSHRVNNSQPRAGQPPLPPGPPPSSGKSKAFPPPPGTREYSGQPPPPPPPSLPPKPPASTRDYRKVPPPSQGSSNQHGRGSHREQRGRGAGRGGRGGRGRGRAR
ncbi:hypothetical protein EsDP_00003324 [Epichloe bromicola]|uniref:CCHC-type domain-containing protein n=1 Tax=Epichloe bromicola TaxID=79588 RepID=A0ABQ0CNE3_9HYPO